MSADKEALARRAEQAIDALVNTAFERLRSERQKWDGTEASRGAWDQARQSWERISNLVADYKRALDMFGWGHAATNGCLLAFVREAFGDRHLFVEYVVDENSFRIACDFDVRVRVWEASKVRLSGFESEAEALVAALEAAP